MRRRNGRPRNALELIRRETYEERDERTRKSKRPKPGATIKHGTVAGYRAGCKCRGCSQAKREANQAYYQAHRDIWKRVYNEKRRAKRREDALAAFVDG